MLAQELSTRSLMTNPKEAVEAKRGTALTQHDLSVLDSILLGSDGASFDRVAFSKACLFQASLLARLGTGALLEMDSTYYLKKPSKEDAEAALVYVQQGTRLLRTEQREGARIAEVAAALLTAGYPEISLQIIACVGGEEYLPWKRSEEPRLPPAENP